MNYFEAYKDVWNFHKRFIDTVCDDNEYWQNVVDEMRRIGRKYNNTKFIHNLIFNELDELERIWKEQRQVIPDAE